MSVVHTSAEPARSPAAPIKPGTVERVLIMEVVYTGPELKPVSGMSVIECSLQGDFAPSLVHRQRPDMDVASVK